MEHQSKYRSVFNAYANEYYDKYFDVAAYKPALDRLLSLNDKSAPRILDVACGPGNLSYYITESLGDYILVGLDIADKMLDIARSKIPDSEFLLMDIRELSNLNDEYDMILCGFALPYLDSEETLSLIRTCSNLLSKGAVLYISTIEGDPALSEYKSSSNGEISIFMNYHSKEEMEDALHKCDLEIVYRDLLEINDTKELIMIATKK